MRSVAAAIACGVFACASSVVCTAQTLVIPKYEVSAGVRLGGPITIASERATEVAPGGATRSLFSSNTRLGTSTGATAGFGVQLSRAVRAEMAAGYGTAQLNTKVSADTEEVANTTVSTSVTQLVAEAGILAQRSRWRTRRMQPFATAGIGYVREMYEGRTLIETASALYVGGGLYYVRASARPRQIRVTGLRVDLRGYVRRGGVASTTKVHTAPEVSATMFVRF